jgi:hypothetical protein
MLSTLKKSIAPKKLLVIFAALLFFSCQKDISIDDGGIIVTPPDLSTKINSSVSGFVTDENDAAVMGATVQFGTSNITTDKYGYFEAKNVQVVKGAAVVTVNKPGYFKGIKTYMAKEGKAAFFRIKLIPKTISGNVNATAGGTVTLSNGLSVKLPAGGIVNAATNAVYTGTVNVAAYWINPTAADLNSIMPGDLRGINTDGAIKLLRTFGMAAVELTGASGELLQIVNGQKATLTMPLPLALAATAPASIPLWYFDEAKGLWKQEGSATKTGNNYVGDVGHFSFWNYDQPGNLVQFDCTLKNAAGNPIGYTLVRLSVNGWYGFGYTDSSGYVSGAVFANSNFILEVFPNYGCSGPVYSQTFTTGSTNISLGVITITAVGSSATLTGTVTNCNNTPVTNGYILLNDINNIYTRYPLNSSGAYSISKLFCSLPQTISFIGEDITNAQQSAIVSYIVNAGANTIPNIQACAVATQQFLNYSINGTTYNFSYPADTFYYNNNAVQSLLFLAGNSIASGHSGNLRVSNTGLAMGSTQTLDQFKPTQVQDTFRITTPVLVNITEYGAVGQFTAGNFTGIFTGASPANTQYNVTCNFRLRRNN